jgi:hypothetical protein
MGSPDTSINENDQTTRVPPFPGVTGAFVIPATKGSIGQPVLCSGQGDLKKFFTPNERIEVDMDLSYSSAMKYLEKGPAYIKRAHNRAMYGASIIRSGSSQITYNLIGQFTDTGSGNILGVNAFIGSRLKTGSPLTVASTTTLPSGLVASTVYFAAIISNTQIQLYPSLVDALALTNVIVIAGGGVGTFTLTAAENLVSGLFTSEFVNNEDTMKISASVGKNLQTGTFVLLDTAGTLPAGLTKTNYYVIKYSDTQIAFATTLLNAINNIPVNITTAGTGVFSLLLVTNSPISLNGAFTINTVDNVINVPISLGSITQTGDSFYLDTNGSFTSTGISVGLYYVVKVTDSTFKLANTRPHAVLGIPQVITLSGTGTGSHFLKKIDESSQYNGALSMDSYHFDTDELILIKAKDPGGWSLPSSSGGVQYTVEDYRDKEDDAFIINVFKTSNLSKPVETWTCSRKHKTDGNGKNIFIEDVLKGSFYIEAINNVLIADTVFPVLNYVPVGLAGGDNGDPVTDSDMINALQDFANPDNVFITLLMDGGWSTPAYQQAMNEIASSRKDTLAIGSIPMSAELNSDSLNAIIDYRKSTNINSSYFCFFTSHQLVLDTDNDRKIYVSPDGFAGAAISQTAANREIWIPVGGWERGIINALKPLLTFSKAQRDKLYDNGINPIRYKPGKGIAIWGQKTALARPSALDRMNVRLLLIQIEPANAEALETFEFNINDVSERSEIVAIIEDYMKGIQAKKGVYDFYVVCDSSNNTESDIDNHELNVDLFIKPTISMEFLKLNVVVIRTGGDFSTALQLVG